MDNLRRSFIVMTTAVLALAVFAYVRDDRAASREAGSAHLPAVHPAIVPSVAPAPRPPEPSPSQLASAATRPPVTAPPRAPRVGVNIFRQRPHNDPMAPPQAVSHVAIYAYSDGEMRVTRSGPWVRTAMSGEGMTISNVGTGVSFTIWRTPDGALRAMKAQASGSAQDYYAYERTDTGERDRVGGERCKVFDWRRVSAHPSESSERRCVTSDGVELWMRSSRPGSYDFSRRLIRVERRPIPESEVAPPPELLQWRTWRERAAPPRIVHDADYEVRMASPEEPRATRIMRAHGDWRYTETNFNAVRHNLQLSGAGLTLHFFRTESGGAELSIALRDPINAPSMERPLADRPPENMLGERCAWIDVAPGADHFSYIECRTADGLVLHSTRLAHGGRGGPSWNFRASHVRRGQLAPAAVDPGQDIFVPFAPTAN